ncbi:MAG: D-aminoacyl-tRNA deacylase [Oenococcus sp.]|uniref:D-aminoacyl-tRNA deacylase n=1 Tax=Oenococcus TaxID=46254 RepID=UPI0021E780B2|nr:D-aminoacyl-tRNA deacylase [Oenococcus kitaharae]MCV3296191.1 D-aminoacyl-tRNA deacylase [Oenococcus kitaharae]
MRVLLQKVSSASVSIDKKVVSHIGKGFLLLVAVEDSDGAEEVAYLVHKIIKLRVFLDKKGKMNLSISDVAGSILSVSQFTLYADTRKGNRPSFTDAGQPAHAQAIYNDFNQALTATGIPLETGVFAADMAVELVNDGPVTIMFDTDQR